MPSSGGILSGIGEDPSRLTRHDLYRHGSCLPIALCPGLTTSSCPLPDHAAGEPLFAPSRSKICLAGSFPVSARTQPLPSLEYATILPSGEILGLMSQPSRTKVHSPVSGSSATR